MPFDDFNNKFRVKELMIYNSKYWVWSLRPNQATLGAGILSLKRECSAFSRLKDEEFADLSNIVKIIESSLKKAFKFDVINYLMLMMFDKQVHYHILPRYEKQINFEGTLWDDLSWPAIPKLVGESSDNKMLEEIILYIKKHF